MVSPTVTRGFHGPDRGRWSVLPSAWRSSGHYPPPGEVRSVSAPLGVSGLGNVRLLHEGHRVLIRRSEAIP